MGGAYNPFNLAMYSYGHQNPVKFTDPDGNNAALAIGGAIAVYIFRQALIQGGKQVLKWGSAALAAMAGNAAMNNSNQQSEQTKAQVDNVSASPAPASPPPDDDGKDGKTEHGKQRAEEAKTDPNRNVGDSNRVIRDGRKLIDNDTGNNVHVSGDRVVITNEKGELVTQFKNTRANTNARIESGRWSPAPPKE